MGICRGLKRLLEKRKLFKIHDTLFNDFFEVILKGVITFFHCIIIFDRVHSAAYVKFEL